MRHLRLSICGGPGVLICVGVLVSAPHVLSAQTQTEQAEKERIQRIHEMLMDVIRSSEDTPTAKPDTPGAKPASDSKSIVGSWQTQGLTLVLHPNGTFERVSHTAPGAYGFNDGGS